MFPPRSPDLSLPDFFLCGHLKGLVYRTPVPSLAALKRRIRAAIRRVPQATLRDAVEQLPLRARVCRSLRGGYPETVLTHGMLASPLLASKSSIVRCQRQLYKVGPETGTEAKPASENPQQGLHGP